MAKYYFIHPVRTPSVNRIGDVKLRDNIRDLLVKTSKRDPTVSTAGSLRQKWTRIKIVDTST
jgi:hypothetical protein